MTNEPAHTALTIVGAEVVDAAQAKAHAELTMATAKARAVVAGQMIKDANLFKRIGNKNYVFVDGWTTLAAMYNLSVSIVWTKREEDGTVRARAELVNMKTGVTLGVAAESECGGEGDDIWIGRTAMAKGSMAQTRATSKVCRLALSWIMVLGGYSGTPAEEMNGDEDSKVEAKSTKGPTVTQLRNQATELVQEAIKDGRMTHAQMVEWADNISKESVVMKPTGDGILIYKAKWNATQAKEIIAVLIPRPADEPVKEIGGKEAAAKPEATEASAPDTDEPPATDTPPRSSGSQAEFPSTAHECPNCGKTVPGLPEGATCNDCIDEETPPTEGSE